MPGAFVPGFAFPGRGGPLFFPQSEQSGDLPLPPDEDLYLPRILNSALIVSAFLPLGFLTPWAGSDEVTITPSAYEEDAFIPPVLVNNTRSFILGAGTGAGPTPPTVIDEEYPYNRPIIWPQLVARLSWNDNEDSVVAIQGIDGDELTPKLPWKNALNPLLLWTGNDDVTVLMGDEGELLPRAPVKSLVSSLLNWDQDEVATPPLTADEGEWKPGASKGEWINPSLSLSRGIADDLASLSITDEGWLPGGTKSPWQASVVIDSTGDFISPIVTFEEDFWLPPRFTQPAAITLLAGTAGIHG